jgi:hypothetical protein
MPIVLPVPWLEEQIKRGIPSAGRMPGFRSRRRPKCSMLIASTAEWPLLRFELGRVLPSIRFLRAGWAPRCESASSRIRMI